MRCGDFYGESYAAAGRLLALLVIAVRVLSGLLLGAVLGAWLALWSTLAVRELLGTPAPH